MEIGSRSNRRIHLIVSRDVQYNDLRTKKKRDVFKLDATTIDPELTMVLIKLDSVGSYYSVPKSKSRIQSSCADTDAAQLNKFVELEFRKGKGSGLFLLDCACFWIMLA